MNQPRNQPRVHIDRSHCDFCNAPNPRFRLDLKSQTFPAGTAIELIEVSLSNPEWLACSACFEFVARHDLTGLVAWAMSSDPLVPALGSADQQRIRSYLTKLYASLLDNLQRN